ncbi:hypothetical protein EV356DRAFT_333425 [Viridothelium virens]|uniref:Uncharacterized protein n=1 Tax=Viridothelium virens TaxID=1048519 RepID=A0A6A6HIP5_VIRVR|nr:hypothetical protein EV356DRAFT_333425 [Viridothelium virens]
MSRSSCVANRSRCASIAGWISGKKISFWLSLRLASLRLARSVPSNLIGKLLFLPALKKGSAMSSLLQAPSREVRLVNSLSVRCCASIWAIGYALFMPISSAIMTRVSMRISFTPYTMILDFSNAQYFRDGLRPTMISLVGIFRN